tara:strand:- start:276 stop:1523 length:1248 start_codon:yes stop_codon:yes gene_type:complete
VKKLKSNIFPFIIAFSALSVSASAAFYSVSGLSKLFAGASFEVIIMAGSLEIAKLVIASLLYQYWDTINKWLKAYLMLATVILVLITSMGIYGFLSAAYQDTYRNLSVKENKISFLTQKKDFYESDVNRYDVELNRISENISILSNAKATGIQVRDTSTVNGFRNTISTTELRLSQKRISVEEENRKITQSKREIVADSLQKYQLKILTLENDSESTGELGPLQYLSGLTGVPMDKIINVLLLVIIFVFDPLALSLVVAANFAFEQANPKKAYKENLYGELEEEKLIYTEEEAIDFFDSIDKDSKIESLEETLDEVLDDIKVEVDVKKDVDLINIKKKTIKEKIEDDGWDIVDEEENIIVKNTNDIQLEINKMQTEYNNLGKYTSNDHKRREMEDNIQRLKKELNEFNEDDTITY